MINDDLKLQLQRSRKNWKSQRTVWVESGVEPNCEELQAVMRLYQTKKKEGIRFLIVICGNISKLKTIGGKGKFKTLNVFSEPSSALPRAHYENYSSFALTDLAGYLPVIFLEIDCIWVAMLKPGTLKRRVIYSAKPVKKIHQRSSVWYKKFFGELP